MAGTPKKLELGPFTPGMNNRRADFKLDASVRNEKAAFLRSAVNVDIDADGNVKRRAGFAQAFVGTDCHSGWASDDGEDAFYIDDTTLYRLAGTPSAPVKTVVLTDLARGQLASYCKAAGEVYFTNGSVIKRINAQGAFDLGVPGFTTTPLVTASTGGSLPAGDYSVCFTQLDSAGRESAATIPQQVNVGANGKLVITELPAVFPSGVASLSIYITAVNASALLRAARLTAPTTTFTYSAAGTLGVQCPTLMLAPMPAGSIVREYNGRLYVVIESTLFYSEPYAFALTNPVRGYIAFPSPITLLEPANNGCFIAVADQTYWLSGDIAQAELQPVAPFGAVPRTSGNDRNSNAVYWMSPRGLIRGKEDGSIDMVQEANVAVDSALVGALLHRRRDGMQQALGGLFGTDISAVAASSFLDAEIIRKAATPL